MSLEATIARAISLHSITTLSSNSSSNSSSNNSNIINSSSINSGSSSCNYKKGDTVVSLKQQQEPKLQQEQYQQQQQQQHQKKSEHSRVHEIITPSSAQARNQQEEKEQRLQNKTKRRAPKPPRSGKKESKQQLSTRTTSSTVTKPPSSCHLLVEQILYTVGELEHTLIEDHQTDFELRMELERQVEKVNDLRSSLEMEKKRNQRLVQLIRGVDSSSSTEDEDFINMRHSSGVGICAASKGSSVAVADAGIRHLSNGCWQSRSSMDAFESISPLLMQQRYDELSTSYKQCQRQMIKKEKLLTRAKCEREELQGHYDHMLDEYRNVQKRFEELCCKYLRLQSKKNQEIQKLREALSYASDCVLSAQQVMEYNDSDANCCIEFRKNLQYFIKALRLCEWVQHFETQRNKR